MASTAALIASMALAAGGAIGSSVNRNKAKESALNYLNSEYYRDPLSTIGNRSLIKSLDQRLQDQNDAMQNRAIAGGATVENQLAARKANNETLSRFHSQLLQGEDARRRAIDSQKQSVIQNGYVQAAQDWQSWGAAASNAAMQYGNASLLDASQAGTQAGSTFNLDEYIKNNNIPTYTV